MKKELIRTGIFALAVAAIGLFTFFEIKKFKQETENEDIKDRVLKVDSSDVKGFSYKIGENPLMVLKKSNGTWSLVSPLNDVTDHTEVDDWVSKLLATEGRLLVKEPSQDDLSKFDLTGGDEPKIYISTSFLEASIEISSKEAFDGSSYVLVKTKEQNEEKVSVYSSSEEWRKALEFDRDKFRSLRIFDWKDSYPDSKVKNFSFTQGSTKLSFEFKDNNWTLLERPNWVLDRAKVDSFLTDVRGFQYKEMITRVDVKKGYRALFGYEVRLDSNETLTLQVWETPSKKFYAEASHRPDAGFVIFLDGKKGLSLDPLDLRSAQDVLKFKTDEIKLVKYIGEKDAVTLKKDGGVWVTDSQVPEGKIFNGSRVFDLLEKLTSIEGLRYEKSTFPFKKSKPSLEFFNADNKRIFQLELGQKVSSVRGENNRHAYLVKSNMTKEPLVIDQVSYTSVFDISFFEDKQNSENTAGTK